MLAGLLGPGQWQLGALVYVASGYCFAIGNTFYNAYLPRLTTVRAAGAGSAATASPPATSAGAAAPDRRRLLPAAAARPGLALGGAWWLAFSLPAYVMMPRTAPTSDEPVRGSLLLAGFRRVGHTFSRVRRYGTLFLFLLAFLTYNNGIDTIINLSPSFGEDALRMTGPELVTMFLVVQFVAAGGAFAFGWLSDRVGNKVVIASNLVVWCVAAVLVLGVQTAWQFTAVGVLIGLVLGGVQSSSRALMAKLAPPEIRDEAFGFFSLSGKAVSVFGPLLYFVLSSQGGPRAGVFAVLPFLVVGVGDLPVRPRAERARRRECVRVRGGSARCANRNPESSTGGGDFSRHHWRRERSDAPPACRGRARAVEWSHDVPARAPPRPDLRLAPAARRRASHAAELQPDELLLIANQNVPVGVDLANDYAASRGVPDGRVLVLKLPVAETMEFAAYDDWVARPVRECGWRPTTPTRKSAAPSPSTASPCGSRPGRRTRRRRTSWKR